jgi:hypothetical protein
MPVRSKYVARYAVILHSWQIMKFFQIRVVSQLNHWRRVSGPVCGRSANRFQSLIFPRRFTWPEDAAFSHVILFINKDVLVQQRNFKFCILFIDVFLRHSCIMLCKKVNTTESFNKESRLLTSVQRGRV